MRLQLPGLVDYVKDEKFKMELGNLPDKIAENIRKWLTVDPIKNSLDSLYDELVYKVTFQPLKPMSTVIDLHVSRPSGGRWNFKIKLKASIPDPDDDIVIRSPLNRT